MKLRSNIFWKRLASSTFLKAPSKFGTKV